MKTNTKKGKASYKASSLYSSAFKSIITIVFFLAIVQFSVQAQKTHDKKHSWWFGLSSGANVNFYRGSTQELNSDLIAPVAFHNGHDAGLNLASLAEFHDPGSSWGFMVQAGYDSRKGTFDEKVAPCGCSEDLSTNLSYITLEPSLRLTPFKFNLYLYGGPRFALNLNKSFVYTITTPSDLTNQSGPLSLNGNFGNMNKVLLSMQIGVGYDIQFSPQHMPTQLVFSPFISFLPYYGQSPRSIETWNITTMRIGASFKFSPHQFRLSNIKRKKNKKLY